MLHKNDDLFKESTMTFGEHLEELRISLMRALTWLAVGFLIGLFVGKYVVAVIKAPLETALGEYYSTDAVEWYRQWQLTRANDALEVPYTVDEVEAFVGDYNMIFEVRYLHPAQAMDELRRIDPEFDVAGNGNAQSGFTPELKLDHLVPLLIWHRLDDDNRVSIKALNAIEAFMIYVKASLVFGVIIASPGIFYHIWSFVGAGLYPHEKKYVHIFLPFSLALFLSGAGVAYFLVFEPVLAFLLSFNRSLGLDPDPRISEWLSFVLMLPLGFGVSFQLPLVMLFLERIGVFDVAIYLEKWRISVMLIFVLAALLTPADPSSMLLMAIPLTVLYFLGILLCHWWPRDRSPFDAADESA